MKFKNLLFVAILFLLATSGYAQSNSSDEQTLKNIVGKMLDAQTAYDGPTLDDIFTEDYIEISPAGEFDPRKKVLGFYSPVMKAARGTALSVSAKAVDHSVRVYDKFAIVISQFDYSIVSGGKPLPPRSVRATMVFRKQKGDWKIASAQYTAVWIPEPPAPPAK